MKKLEQIKQTRAQIESPNVKIDDHFSDSAAALSSELNQANMVKRSYFMKGFDVAIALDLPSKFTDWLAKEGIKADRMNAEGEVLYFKYEGASHDLKGTSKQLFEYWIENVYKPE